ncbi:MAG: hypothetical protein M1825_005751 [Sarcosagium campestre]|nr:MAG: hypothetical protein M1825_005751 [Sarcosagium campestre]
MASKKRKLIPAEWLEANILAQPPEDGLPDAVKAALEEYKISKAAAAAPSVTFGLKPIWFLKHDEQFDVPSELDAIIYITLYSDPPSTKTDRRKRPSREAAASISAESGQQAEASEELRPKTPTKSPLGRRAQISLYMETRLSGPVVYKDRPRILSGIADYTLGYAGAGEKHAANLIIVESKRRWELDSAFGQLLVYMAIVHSARKDENKDHTIVWGVATDGTRYNFWRVSSDGSVGMSTTFDWNQTEQRRAIYSTLRAITRAALISSPTTSPVKGEIQKQFAEMFTISKKDIDFKTATRWDEIFVSEENSDIEVLPPGKD